MKVAVILSGSGHMDGSEIQEAVLALLFLDQQGANVSIFAPDKAQAEVMDHRTRTASASETRNVLLEAARIARGQIEPLSTLHPDVFDALVIPGGLGVAKNLSDFAARGQECSIDTEFRRVVRAFYDQKKPIGAICIAPAVVAAILRDEGVTLTIGEDKDCAFAINALGNIHQNAATDHAVIDRTHRIASCPAYMRGDAPIRDVASGIEQVISAVTSMARASLEQAA
jgi:enhancing lycopene biosynthesis protein 2